MRVLEIISQKAGQAGLPFLIIGGYAVMAHGFARSTDDLDLLAQASKRSDWRSLLENSGASVYNEASAFLQFNPLPGTRLPLDIMFVPDEMFARMRAVAEQVSIGPDSFQVVSLLHLIALKCHALQHGKGLRSLKDMDDIIQLITINRLDLKDPEVKATILKHGNQELYEKLQRACASE
jgi:hypothetical protein